jgi:FAD:protein FMN transferase
MNEMESLGGDLRKEFRIQRKLMGSAFELVVVAENETQAAAWLDLGLNEIQRLETLLTEFRPDSITNAINHQAGIQPVSVPEEVFALVERCLRLSSLTQGAFDITMAPLKKLYDFKNVHFQPPDQKAIAECLECLGHQYVELDGERKTVFLRRKGMRVSFAAVGKGYAADRVKQIWRTAGVPAGVVNASGDLNTMGQRADGNPWKVGIVNPARKEEVLYYVPLMEGAVATSGDYEKFFLWDGKRYSHNIDPKTGIPLRGIQSVTVFAPSAELADALATATYVMGVKAGIHFINQLPRTYCIIIDEHGETFFSKKLHLEYEA